MENFQHCNDELKPQLMTLRYAGTQHGCICKYNIYSNQYTIDTKNTKPYCNI